MTAEELELFHLIEDVRRNAGCGPIHRDSRLTAVARSDAKIRARLGSGSDGDTSMSAAGGDGWTAKDAFDKMLAQSRSTILNCSLNAVGVGFASHKRCTFLLCLGGMTKRNVWVANFEQ